MCGLARHFLPGCEGWILTHPGFSPGMAYATPGCVYLGVHAMSSLASGPLASLAPTRLPSVSAAKAAGSASTSGSSSASASGDSTSYVTNADGSISITTTNAQGQIVSISTSQATATPSSANGFGAQTRAALGSLVNQLF